MTQLGCQLKLLKEQLYNKIYKMELGVYINWKVIQNNKMQMLRAKKIFYKSKTFQITGTVSFFGRVFLCFLERIIIFSESLGKQLAKNWDNLSLNG